MSGLATILMSHRSQPDHGAPDAAPARHYAMLAFVCLSLLMGMLVVQQTTGIERGSWQYLVYVTVAIALPLASLPAIIRCLLGRCVLLLVWLLWAGVWFFWMGDDRAVGQLALLVFVTSWVATDPARLDVGDLGKIYVGLIVVGTGILTFTAVNPYSLIPGQALPDFGAWRVSFFPNIAYSGILSLALLMMLTRDARSARSHPGLMIIASYFLVFSFVRAALLAALMYFALRWGFEKLRPRPRQMFWISLIVAVGFVALTAVSAKLLFWVQDYPGVSTFLLRGKSSLTVDQIAYQLYRPWLWDQQLSLFLSSGWLMGWGSADFSELVATFQAPPQTVLVSAGSESLPTRMLTAYGLSGLLFLIYLFQRLHHLALANDRWACACFPAVFSLMTTWGGVFHPADGMFVLFMLMMTKGSKGFTSQEDEGGHDFAEGVEIRPMVTRAL